MMRHSVCLAAGTALLTIIAVAEANAASRLPSGVPAAAALLLRYDANGDNVVTREEMEAGLKADYNAADANHDHCLDPKEVAAENMRRLERDGVEASPLKDWNLDGCVDMREFSNTAHSYFDLADRTRDGRVNLTELRGPSMPIPPRTVTAARQSAGPVPASQAPTNAGGGQRY